MDGTTERARPVSATARPGPFVLVHGGGFDSRCWDLLVGELDALGAASLAVDLPGRGRRPASLRDVTLADCAAAVRDDVDAAGLDEIVLVGHSLAGCSVPATIGLLGARVRHAVFVACTVPPDGHSAYDTLPADVQELIDAAGDAATTPMLSEIAARVLGDDLDEAQLAWCTERLVGEAPQLTTEPVDLTPLRAPFGRTWVRTTRDLIIPPGKQLAFAANVGRCPVVDLDAGHMCMVSKPAELAALLVAAAARH